MKHKITMWQNGMDDTPQVVECDTFRCGPMVAGSDVATISFFESYSDSNGEPGKRLFRMQEMPYRFDVEYPND